MQHFEERIEEIVAENIRIIQTKTKQKEQDEETKEVSNSQLQKETLKGDGKRKEKAEEQSVVIELQKLIEINSQNIINTKQKIILLRRNSRT